MVLLEGKGKPDRGIWGLKGHDPILPFGGFPINYSPPFLSLCSFSLDHFGVEY